MRIYFWFLLFLSVGSVLQAQEHKKTSATHFTRPHKDKGEYSKQKLIEIRKSNTKGLLYGNVCVMQLTHEYGFEYAIDHKRGYELQNFLHNQASYFRLFFKNGPFWRVRFNKKKKYCVEQTGDYVG